MGDSIETLHDEIASLQRRLSERATEQATIGRERAVRADECRAILEALSNGWIRTKQEAASAVRERLVRHTSDDGGDRG